MYAFAQQETNLGQDFLREALELDPSIKEGNPCRLLEHLVGFSILDQSEDHEKLIALILDQLPSELVWLSQKKDWAVARGYLFRGTKALMWGRDDEGKKQFIRAGELCAEIDEAYLRNLAANMLIFEMEFGIEATEAYFRKITPFIERIGDSQKIRWLKGYYSFNRGIQSYMLEDYGKVPQSITRAMLYYPEFLCNRGAYSIMLRSILARL